MAAANTTTSAILREQVPEFIKEEHDTFVKFLESYYEFMELEEIPVRLPVQLTNPDPTIYPPSNPYGGGDFVVGERIVQKANPDDPNEVTAEARVFSWSGNTTAQTAVITSITGTEQKFFRNFEIVGASSGIKYYPLVDVEKLCSGPDYALRNMRNNKDLDEITLDTYVEFIKKEFAPSLPRELFSGVDTAVALKNIREFYKSRGTENSFKFLFRLLYGEDIEIYLPETDMLRASDANWKNLDVIRTTVPLFDIQNSSSSVSTTQLISRTIRGKSSKATATVEFAKEVVYGGFRFAELELSDIKGTFLPNETIRTTNIGDGSVIEVQILGLVTSVSIDDPGSNYKVGDRISVSAGLTETGKATGAIVEVSSVNASSGSIQSVNIIEPGYDYTKPPILDATGPHNGEAGAVRFSAEPLETVFYEDFSSYLGANTFFAESDLRGSKSNVGTTHAHPNDSYGIVANTNPQLVTGNSVLNFTTTPKKGLRGYWKMQSYHPDDVRINSLDSTLGDGSDPVANSFFRGPRVSDILYLHDRRQIDLRTVQLQSINYSYSHPDFVGDRDSANTYNPNGWIGFNPVVYDESGNGLHARVARWEGGDLYASSFAFSPNLYSEFAFANVGIFGASSNSYGTATEGGFVLASHDDVRHANTQSWVFWYNPTQTDAESKDLFVNLGRLIDRGSDTGSFSLSVNTTSTVQTSGYVDGRWNFGSGIYDNGNFTSHDKLANSSGYFPGSASGAIDSGGLFKINTWNMIAITMDYDNAIANVHVFNTDDGLHCSNGTVMFLGSATANLSNWNAPINASVTERQGRAVFLGESSSSANGDYSSYGITDYRKVYGQFSEVRYYDRALNFQEVESLFYNPDGRYDRVLSGKWKPIPNFGNDFTTTPIPAIDFISDTTSLGGKYIRMGISPGDSVSDGLAVVHNENIPYDPTIRYKMTVRARDGSVNNASNCYLGIIGVSNTGTSLTGLLGADTWEAMSAVVQSPGGVPAESGSLGPDWTNYVGVFGGNATSLGAGTIDTASFHQYGHGGNTAQDNSGIGNSKRAMTWAQPAKLHGSLAAAYQQGTGNTTFIRPIVVTNFQSQDDSTEIDYIKIERQKDASLSASIGAQFKFPGEYLDDSGKLGTSPQNSWIPKFIQDSRFYQIYSYVIKSGLSIGTYKDVVKRLVHPAGLALFSQVNIQSLASVKMAAFAETFSGDIVDLIREYYLGAESSLIEDYLSDALGGRGIVYKTTFGLQGAAATPFNLDLAHGETPYGAGLNANGVATAGSPGWLAWEESPLTSPFANSHYYTNTSTQFWSNTAQNPTLWPYDPEVLPTSNAYTTVTDDTLIWHIQGEETILAAVSQNANVGARAGQHYISPGYGFVGQPDFTTGQSISGFPQKGYASQYTSFNIGQNLWDTESLRTQSGWTFPFAIDGGQYRYVRMKVRRIGPGGYGNDSWMGICRAETQPNSIAIIHNPTRRIAPSQFNSEGWYPNSTASSRWNMGYSGNSVSQPSTLILPPDADENATTPWHILEWDMWNLGVWISGSTTYPTNGGKEMWKWANSSTGSSYLDGGSGRRVSSIAFHLVHDPDNVNERFEIEWIQVDDGSGWPRGSYALPAGYHSNTDAQVSSLGTGTGGLSGYEKVRVSEYADTSNQTLGDYSVAVEAGSPCSGEMIYTAPVLYTSSEKRITESTFDDTVFDANGAIFRVSANTANNLDWIVTEIIDSEKLLRTANTIQSQVHPNEEHRGYVAATPSANGLFSGPVIVDTDTNDNLYLGYVYEHYDLGSPSYPGLTLLNDSKPLMLFKLSPTANGNLSFGELSDPYNIYSAGSVSPPRGRSNNFSVEQIMWGDSGGTEGTGVMVGGSSYLVFGSSGESNNEIEITGSDIQITHDDSNLGSMYVVGSGGDQSVLKIMPAANGSFGNGVVSYTNDIGTLQGRRVFELANSSTYDADGIQLGLWKPRKIIQGPKNSLFIACDTGYSDHPARNPYTSGSFDRSDAVYCYHLVVSQNTATGTYYTQNIYPVYANTSSEQYLGIIKNIYTPGVTQRCAGLVLDNEDPPNLYYMNANTVVRISPRGYSYRIGDATVEQILPERYLENTLNYPPNYLGMLGWYKDNDLIRSSSDDLVVFETNYMQIQVDERNRLFFGGKQNLYCYSRGSNTDLLLFNQSNTEFSTLQVVANSQMYTSNITWQIPTGSGTTDVSFGEFALGPREANSAFNQANSFSEGVYLTMGAWEGDWGTSIENPRNLIAIYPNANGSFVEQEGGQLALTIMDGYPDLETRFDVDGTGGINKYRGTGPAKLKLRPKKVK